jgi:hypothetical protein
MAIDYLNWKNSRPKSGRRRRVAGQQQQETAITAPFLSIVWAAAEEKQESITIKAQRSSREKSHETIGAHRPTTIAIVAQQPIK